MKNSRFKSRDFIKKAVEFHGHLGPYLILGLLMGDAIINEFKFSRHFGTKVIVKGATEKPRSCMIDGLQLSTGCTYGKGNIEKISAPQIEVQFLDLVKKKKVRISLREDLQRKLEALKGHKDSESFAKALVRLNTSDLFVYKL